MLRPGAFFGSVLVHPEKRTVLENYAYTDIVTWGHSDEKFIVVVGNIVQQRKLIFKTADGKAMNHLIHDYVKLIVAKVKNKDVAGLGVANSGVTLSSAEDRQQHLLAPSVHLSAWRRCC